jgi:hypothetical protein
VSSDHLLSSDFKSPTVKNGTGSVIATLLIGRLLHDDLTGGYPASFHTWSAQFGTIDGLVDWSCNISTGNSAMSDDVPPPPFVDEGLDPVPEPKPALEKVSEAVKDTAQRVGDAIDAGRKPGRPLSILSNIAREAPLGSLLVAFLLGVVVARRR